MKRNFKGSMWIGKARTKRRSLYGKRRGKKTGSKTSMLLAKRRRRNKLRRDLGMEVKHFDENGSLQPVPFDNAALNQAVCDANNQIIFDPPINLGTAVNQRIGNRITLTGAQLKYAIALNPTTQNGVAIPAMVRIIIYYDRQDDSSLPTPYVNGNFFDSGNTSTGFRGDLTDMFRRYNRDRYRICMVRTHKIGFANNQGSTGSATNQYFANNDFKMNVRGTMNIGKYMLKKIRFNDSLSSAQGRKLYALVIVTPPNFGNFDTSKLPVEMEFQTRYSFTDA